METSAHPGPPDWESGSARPVRLENPEGTAAAWIAVEHGANCIAYTVRRAGGWVDVFHSAPRAELAAFPSRYGCPVLFPFPGYVRGASYTWGGVRRALPPNVPGTPHHAHGFAHDRPWVVADVSASHLTAELRTPTALRPDERRAYPFEVMLRITVELREDALHIRLEARNDGKMAAPVGLGLHPYFATGPEARSSWRARLPGRSVRLLSADAAADNLGEAAACLGLPPTDRALLVGASDLGENPIVRLERAQGDLAVTCTLADGFTHVLLYAPAGRASVAIEPLTCAPGAAAEGGVRRGLLPGETLRAALVTRLEPSR